MPGASEEIAKQIVKELELDKNRRIWKNIY